MLERQLLQSSARFERRGGATPASQCRRPSGRLSYSQQQLWFLDQWEPGSAVYNASLVLRFDGQLDEDALRRAVQTIVDRHECLRTVAIDVEGLPTATLLEDPVFDFHRIDLTTTGIPSDEEIVEAARPVVRIPFDLGADLLMRVGLIKVAPDAHVVCLVQHHMVCDGLSRGIIFDEVAALYTAYVQGQADPLPPLPVQYGDFALWQYNHLPGRGAAGRGRVLAERGGGRRLRHRAPDGPPPPGGSHLRGRSRTASPSPRPTPTASGWWAGRSGRPASWWSTG